MSPTPPRYPIYVPSKGRAARCMTARFLVRDECPFYLVVEPQEAEEYVERYGEERVLVLPFANLGQGSIPARNWIRDHSIAAGHDRHWQLDDNAEYIARLWRGKRIVCNAALALRAVEDFTDRYENIGISGLNYWMFVPANCAVPFYLNCHVYSCTLIDNRMPYHWRGRYNEDTDLCLQVLSAGLCTVAFNAFVFKKAPTLSMQGGNTDELYAGDGRLRMARSLERQWPGVVETKRLYGRPQHSIRGHWRRFDTPLKRREDVDWGNLPAVDDYGMGLVQTGDEIRSPSLRAMYEEQD